MDLNNIYFIINTAVRLVFTINKENNHIPASYSSSQEY